MKTLLLCLTLAACRLYAQDTSFFRHLPPDAIAIYQFNLPVLTTRISWQEMTAPIPIPQPSTYNRELALILRDPDRAGVDVHRPLCRRSRPALNAPFRRRAKIRPSRSHFPPGQILVSKKSPLFICITKKLVIASFN